MEVELEEYFGALVVVQLRDGLLRVEAGAEQVPHFIISPSGEPRLDQKMAPTGRMQVKPLPSDDKHYSLIYVGRLLPAKGGRVHLCYEVDGYVVRTTLRPKDILAVTWVEGKSDSRIERPASA